MTAAALDALDAWREIGEFIASPRGWEWLETFNRLERERRTGLSFHQTDDSDFPDTVLRALLMSSVYAARPDTVDLVTAAAETVPYHPVLSGDELPTKYGFVRLAKPFTIRDVRDRDIRVHAVQWWPTSVRLQHPGGEQQAAAVAYVIWSRSDDMEDDYSKLAQAEGDVAALWKWPLSLSGMYPADQAAFDVSRLDVDGPLITLRVREEDWAGSALTRWLLSWWMVVKEQMIEVTEEVAPRSGRRRFARAGGGVLSPPTVNVVDLRRRDRTPSVGTGPGVDWSHRWTVRPHWRRQWYPSLAQHKLKLINGYVKGPEDKPLVARPTVFDIRPPKD